MNALIDTIELSDQEFALFQAYVYREAGIYLSAAKRALVAGRLSRRLRALGLRSYGAYFRHATAGDNAEECTHLLDCITTNETRFFREPAHFEFLTAGVYPAWRNEMRLGRFGKTIRVWSAGCSTGEEPFSVAMSLLGEFGPELKVHVEIMATDLSVRALQRASAAVWPIEGAQAIPAALCKRFMLRGVGAKEGTLKAGPELRATVTFSQLNLNATEEPRIGVFDLVFCRNVLIYFDQASKQRAVARLLARLKPGGYFFVGHAETLAGVSDEVRSVRPTIYRKPA